MAAPIIIRAELNNSDLRRAADETEKAFKSAIDRINQHAQRLRDTFSGLGEGLSGVGRGGGRGGSGGGGASNAANESLRLAQAQARLQATSRDTAGAINVLNNAIDQSTAKERVLIGAKIQLAALFNRQEAETKKVERARIAEAAATQRSANADLAKAQALARLKQVQGDTVGAARVLQTALDGSTASMNRQLAAQTQLQRVQNINQAGWRRYASTIREAGESIQQAGYGLLALTGGIVAIGRSAVQSAINIDKQVNSLRALTGSAQAAEARFKALFELSQRTPGLTTSLALSLDAQLRAANVSEANINRVLPAVGRINAVSPLGDPQKFAQNLLQLVTQNFERTDLKELVGQSPIAGRIISELFNVENPTNAKAIRESAEKLGLTSADAFFKAFGETAAKSPALANVTESLGTQIEKLQDRIGVALRPLGVRLLQIIVPAIEKIVPVIERLLDGFAKLPPSLQTGVIALGALAAAVGPAVIALGGIIQTVGAFGNLVTVFTALSGAGAAAAGVGGGVAAGGGIAAITGALTVALPVIGAVTIAVGALAAAWYSDFGGIRQATSDAWDNISREFERLGPIRSQIANDLTGIRREFQTFSDDSRPIVQSFFEFFSGVASGAIAEVTQQVSGITSILAGAFSVVRENVLSPAGRALSAVLGSAPALPANPLQTPTVPLAPKRSTVLANEATGANRRGTLTAGARTRVGRGGGTASAEREQLRNAERLLDEQNRLDVERIRAANDLQKDANTRAIEEDERSYRLRLISADEFYRNKQGLLEANIGNEINLLTRQLDQAQAAFSRAKGGSPEQLAAEREVLSLRTQIEIKTRELGAVEKSIFDERLKNIGKDKDILGEQLQITEERSAIEEKILNTIKERVTTEQQAIADEKERLQQQLDRVRADAATVGANLGLKEQLAQEDAILRVRQADEDAYLSMVQNRVRLADASVLNSNRANAIFLDHLAQQKSVTESTADAMISAYEGVAGSIDKGIDSLTRKLGIFGEAISGILKSITRSILSSIFAPGGGGGQGGGSVIGNLFGGLLGGNRGNAAGGLGGFLTPGFNPNASGGGGGGIGNIIGSLGGLFGGGLPAPSSVSLGGLPAGRSFPVGLSSQPGGLAGRAGGFFGNIFGGLGNLFGGIGFGRTAGSGGALASALPLLGIGLGSSLGGSSGLGQLLGGVGGGLLGIGLTAAPAGLAGGALGFLAPLFSNPITAIVGAALLPTAFLIGRARQRRKDERASGDFLQNAIDSIRDLRGSVARDEIDGTQARKIFRSEILETFKQQIGTLKTKSVRESRLTNQVRDLEKLYKDEVVPEIEKQATRRKVFGRLTPEFATGGVMPFDGFAFLHKGEIIANPRQQTPALVNAAAAAGVPGVQAVGGGGMGAINLYVSVGISKSQAEEITAEGMDSETGQALLLNLLNQATKNGDYRR